MCFGGRYGVIGDELADQGHPLGRRLCGQLGLAVLGERRQPGVIAMEDRLIPGPLVGLELGESVVEVSGGRLLLGG